MSVDPYREQIPEPPKEPYLETLSRLRSMRGGAQEHDLREQAPDADLASPRQSAGPRWNVVITAFALALIVVAYLVGASSSW